MIKFLKKILKKNKFINKCITRWNSRKQAKEINNKKQIINEYGNKVVADIESCLSETGLIFFATCGTLLGLIRENRLLKNDYDMDYGILIKDKDEWKTLEKSLNKIGYKKIRDFILDGDITEETYKNGLGVEIDFFGHFIIEDELCFYSYDKLTNQKYISDQMWTAYILKNGKFYGTKKINTDIGCVTVPINAEEYLTYNYNDNWRIPDPNFKANTGKGCSMIDSKYGIIRLY